MATAISDDGALVVVSGGESGRIQIRDGATGELLREVEPSPRPEDAVMVAATVAVAFTPDGDLVVGSQAGPIRIVDPRSGAELRRIDSPQETSDGGIFVNADGTEIVTIGALGSMGFDLASGEALWAEPHALPFCPTWEYAERIAALLCGRATGQVTAYDVVTGLQLGKGFDSQLGGVCSLAISDDGARFAVVSSCFEGATIVERRLDGGGAVSRLVVDTRGEHRVQTFGFGGDEDALVAEFSAEGDDVAATYVVDAATGTLLDRFPGTRELTPSDKPQRAIAYFPQDRTVRQYDTEQRQPVGRGVDIAFEIDRITTSHDHVVVNGWDPETDGSVVTGVNLETGRFVPPTIKEPPSIAILHVAIGPAGLYTARYARAEEPNYQVQRRDLSTGAVLVSVPGFSNVATGAGILVASTTDGRILELDPTSLQPVGAPFPGTNGSTQTLSVDADGRRLMVLGDDEMIRYYDVATRTQLGDAIDMNYGVALGNLANDVLEEVAGAVLRGDGMQAAADTGQGIVVWDLDPDHWVDAACQLAGRNLTHAEWDQHIGDLARYRRTCPEFDSRRDV
jgi:WD40 repeat protein